MGVQVAKVDDKGRDGDHHFSFTEYGIGSECIAPRVAHIPSWVMVTSSQPSPSQNETLTNVEYAKTENLKEGQRSSVCLWNMILGSNVLRHARLAENSIGEWPAWALSACFPLVYGDYTMGITYKKVMDAKQ